MHLADMKGYFDFWQKKMSNKIVTLLQSQWLSTYWIRFPIQKIRPSQDERVCFKDFENILFETLEKFLHPIL